MPEQTPVARPALSARSALGAQLALEARSALGAQLALESRSAQDTQPSLPAASAQGPGGPHGSETSDYRQIIGGVALSECEPMALVSVAFHPAHTDQLAATVGKSCQLGWPPVGHSTLGNHGIRLLGLQADQYWLMWPSVETAADRTASQWLPGVPACLTDQSDGWACLEMQGEACRAVLERLCAVDLSDTQCPVNAARRTPIEHVGTMLIRADKQRFQFITPRSSVRSLLHAMESVAWHVHNEQALHQAG